MALKRRLKKDSAEKIKVTAVDVDNMAEEYHRLSEQIAVLTKRKTELSNAIKEVVASLGTKDNKGSQYLNTSNFVCGRVHSQKIDINQDKAYEYLTNHQDTKGGSFADCIHQVTTYVVDEDDLAKAVKEGRIDIKTLRDNCYDVKESYSVSVKPKKAEEETPEVEVTSLKKAARRK